ncbi:DUF188 domain-containing protein [Ectobacillus polymachus]|uniref:DUF188 domain-containing protein n=1 Tax=Ectobacillus polymachus TaxID=1508806 RepID=UPI003A86BCD2
MFGLQKKYEVELYFIASYPHKTYFKEGNWIYVDSFKDEVDFYIYKHTKKGDLVVTQDMGLASC